MRRKKDEHFGMICRFFDQEKRCCGIYPARPAVCRSFPGPGRCGYSIFFLSSAALSATPSSWRSPTIPDPVDRPFEQPFSRYPAALFRSAAATFQTTARSPRDRP